MEENATKILEKARAILKKHDEKKTETVVKLGEAILEDGTTIYFDGMLETGTSVWTIVNGENVPLPAGTYKLPDGKNLVITEAGIVATISPAQTEEEPTGEETVEATEETAKASVEETTEAAPTEPQAQLSAEDIEKIVAKAVKPLEEKILNLQKENSEANETITGLKTQLSEEPSDSVVAKPEGDGTKRKAVPMADNGKLGLNKVLDVLYGG